MKAFDPFANERDSLQIDVLTIENRIDKVSIYGSVDITRDKKGLKVAQRMEALLRSIVKKLSEQHLPDSIPLPKEPDMEKSPFE